MNIFNESFDHRRKSLIFYSPYSFSRTIPEEILFNITVKGKMLHNINIGKIQTIEIIIDKESFYFLIEYLAWDSDFFELPTYRLHTVLFLNDDINRLIKAVCEFKASFFNNAGMYCFSIIPSEDINLIMALNSCGFKLLETRMTYYLDLSKHNHERYKVREATLEDIPNLRRVAVEMRNPFDRFHVDPIFTEKQADEFVATYIEESIKGFADHIIVPAENGVPPDAFLTANFLKSEWPIIGSKISKMILTAVSSKTCKGWYKKLISEMAYFLRDQGADYVFMHPASTNKATIHTYENLGCHLAQVSHVLSYSS